MPEENEQMAYKGQKNRLSKRMMIYFFVLGILSLILVSFFAGIDIMDRAGGGGGSSSGGGNDGWSSGWDDDDDDDWEAGEGNMDPTVGLIIIIIVIIIIVAMILEPDKKGKKLDEKVEKVERALLKISEFDPSWDRDMLMAFTSDTFFQVQDAWSNKDRMILQDMLSPGLFTTWNVMLTSLDDHQQRNVVEKIRIEQIDLVDVRDFTNDARDQFTAKITASTVDYSIDEQTGRWAYPRWRSDVDPNRTKQQSTFTEFWTFQWKGEGCRLIKIDQSGAQGRFTSVENILADQKYFESAATGRSHDEIGTLVKEVDAELNP